MRSIASLAAGMLLALPQVALAAEPPCLTPSEATAVASYALPSVISGTAERCSATLGASAYLPRNGAQLAQRYAARKAAVWPEAKGALIKLSSTTNPDAMDMMKSLPDKTLQGLADTLVSGVVADKIPLTRCGVIDRFMALVSPLPPESTAELISLTLGLVSQGAQPKLGKLSVCKA